MPEKTISSKRGFDGRLLKVDVLEVELQSGRRSIREIIRHPGAAVVLGRLPDGNYVFVRQFRKAIESELIEAVAGGLNEGENPDQCAVRELAEETGYRAKRMTKLGLVFPAPGYTDEKLHIYFAELDPQRGITHTDEDESIELVLLDRTQVEGMLAKGEINDAKTLAAWMMHEKTADR
jgi:ADP-ribose pyrophosphatase